jgi:hypothetical protein
MTRLIRLDSSKKMTEHSDYIKPEPRSLNLLHGVPACT